MIFMLCSSQAQDAINIDNTFNSDTAIIRWVSQFPSSEGNIEKQNILKKIGNFLFGKKSTGVIKPISVLAKNPNSFWILDQGNRTLVEVNKNLAEIPKPFSKKTDYFTSLIGICSMPSNDILFTDSRSNKIYLLSEDSKRIKELNDSLILDKPTGIAYSKTNKEIWITESGAHRISVLNENGKLIKTIGNRGGGPGEFNFPTHIWIDQTGNVYVIDALNFRVQIFDKNGEFVSFFGKTGDATGYFARPKGIATDSRGNIYIVDTLFHMVQVFNKSGKLLYYFGGQGRDKGHFWMPSGIFIDDEDFIYIADSYNSRVQIFQLVKSD